MAVRSTIEIDVKDEAFDAFRDKFEKYREAVKTMPGSWAAAGKEMHEDAVTMSGILAALMAHAELLSKVRDETRKNQSQMTLIERTWKNVAEWTRQTASNVSNATSALLRWTSIGTAITGLLGFGGIFGLDRLANDVAARRRYALGLGTTYGEEKAFETDYGRFVDPNQFLGGVNTALHDLTKRYGFYGAGLTEADLRGKDTAQVAVELLPQLKRIADQTPSSQIGQAIQARGLDQFVTVQDMERLKAMSATEIAQLEAAYQRDKISFNLSAATQRKWQDFSTQMSRAGQKIENVFVRGLTPLTPALTQLSDSIAKSIDTLMKSGKLEEWMKKFGKGLENLATYIASDKFQRDLKEFADDVSILAHKIASALKWLGLIPDHDAEKKKAEKQTFWQATGTLLNPFNLSPSDNARAVETVTKDLKADWHWAVDQGFSSKPVKRTAFYTGEGQFSDLEKKKNLPSGLLSNVFGAESAYGARAGYSSAGALGPFQLMEKTAERFGVKDRTDIGQASKGAADYFAVLLKEFGGDVRKAVAAYNWGEGHLERAIRKWGDQWVNHLPSETRDYLNKVINGAHLAHGVKIQIDNNTGGNTVVTASQLAQ